MEGVSPYRMTPPPVDRVAASRAAVAARRARAEVKNAVATQRRSAVDVLDAAWTDPEATVEAGLRVKELLQSIPTLGPTRVAKAMSDLGIAASKRAGGLGARQRVVLRDWLVRRNERLGVPPAARLVVLAGPTAVGKGTVSTHIRESYPEVHLSVSATTRRPRPGEIDGRNYFFVDDDEFDRLVAEGEMLEWATVHNAFRYGTPRKPVEEALAVGRSVLLEIDLQGARQVREAMPSAVLVFLLPPSWEELVRRLIGRGTEKPEEQQRRLATARVELAAQDEFDHRVVNGDVGEAAREVVDLMALR
ncbi:MAG: hypothetical protein RI885_2763 [Actinomycetota bacterium]|jgi:guanylate kinase